MILDLVNKLLKPVMLIACISMFLTWAFNIKNVLITTTIVNGFEMKVVDFRIYLNNLNSAWQTNALNFEDILPSRTWQEPQGTWLDNQYWNAIVNNMALLLDWLYFPINFILYIIRWASWIIRLMLSLIGWSVGKDQNGNYYSTLIQILDWITQNLMIPYA